MIPSEVASQLLDLIEIKSFSDLSLEEKNLVKSWISEEAYQDFHLKPALFIKALKSESYKAEGTQKVRQNLFTRLDELEEKRKPLHFLMYPVPAYQVAASIALILGLSLLWRFSGNKTANQQTIVVRDTLYKVQMQIKEIAKTDTIIKLVYSKSSPEKILAEKPVPDTSKYLALNSMSSMVAPMELSILYDTNHSTGASLKEDSNLLRFCVKTF